MCRPPGAMGLRLRSGPDGLLGAPMGGDIDAACRPTARHSGGGAAVAMGRMVAVWQRRGVGLDTRTCGGGVAGWCRHGGGALAAASWPAARHNGGGEAAQTGGSTSPLGGHRCAVAASTPRGHPAGNAFRWFAVLSDVLENTAVTQSTAVMQGERLAGAATVASDNEIILCSVRLCMFLMDACAFFGACDGACFVLEICLRAPRVDPRV